MDSCNSKLCFTFSIHSLLLIFLLSLSHFGPGQGVQAANVIPGDVDYFWYSDPQQEYIFPQEYEHLLPLTIEYSQKLTKMYEKSFRWTLDEKSFTILSSSKNQIANASSTVLPYSTNTLYGGGPQDLESFAVKSWLLNLIIHEMDHLYQMNPKQGLAKWTKTLFGNHLFFIYPIIPVPVFVHPNILLPTWIVEGHAVFSESLLGNGGRLYSGEERALFFALLKAGLLDEERLINNHIQFPYQREKYTVGGFFNLFLARLYGIARTNQLFTLHSHHYFNPLRINSSFKEHFGKDYYQLLQEFLQIFGKLAKKQREGEGTVLTTSIQHFPFNSDDHKIFYLTNKKGKGPYLLNIFHKKSSQLAQRPIDLLPGKIFEIEKDLFVSATNATLDNQEIVYGLWGENKTFYPEFHSKVVMDMQGPPDNRKTLYFDAKTSFDGSHLYLNETSLGKIHSTAHFDPQGNIYYFKQQNKIRTLYKNHQEVFSLNGYYGKITEVDEEGTIYFIGSTTNGSSLFSYKNQHFFRLSPSDVIVDAIKIQGEQFLVCEVTGHHYQYKVLTTSNSPQSPWSYRYFFEKKIPQVKLTQELQEISSSPKTQPYHSLTSLRFQAWEAQSTFGNQGRSTFKSYFRDPLQFNSLDLGGRFDHREQEKILTLQYTNNRYLTSWSLELQGVVEKKKPLAPDPNLISPAESYVDLGLKRPLFDWHHWNTSLMGSFLYYDRKNNPEEYYVGLDAIYTKSYPLSFSPHRHLSLQGESFFKESGKQLGFNWQGILDLGEEHILEQEGVLHYDTTGEIVLGSPLKGSRILLPIQEYSYYSPRPITGGRVGLGFKKVINQGAYFSVFPLSLRRWSPRIFANGFSYRSSKTLSYQEAGLGIQGEYLLAHLFPFKLGIDAIKRYPHGDLVILLSLFSL